MVNFHATHHYIMSPSHFMFSFDIHYYLFKFSSASTCEWVSEGCTRIRLRWTAAEEKKENGTLFSHPQKGSFNKYAPRCHQSFSTRNITVCLDTRKMLLFWMNVMYDILIQMKSERERRKCSSHSQGDFKYFHLVEGKTLQRSSTMMISCFVHNHNYMGTSNIIITTISRRCSLFFVFLLLSIHFCCV